MENLESRGGWLVTLIYFLAWVVTAAGAILDTLMVRAAVLSILSWLNVLGQAAYHNRGGLGEDFLTTFGLGAVDNFLLLILGCGAVAVIIWIEYYFRKGRMKGLLFKRIGKVAIAEVVIIVVSMIIRQLIAIT